MLSVADDAGEPVEEAAANKAGVYIYEK